MSNCLACGREIPPDRCIPAGVRVYPASLCSACVECVWSGSEDGLTVVNALIARITQAEEYGQWASDELSALAPREPVEIPLF